MAETRTDEKKTRDPFEPFRGMRDAYLESLSKSMIDAVNTEGYAQATGAMLDYYLTASAPFREALEKTMLQAMQQLSIPSRQDVASLAERFTNVEIRLDDMDAKLDHLAEELAALRKGAAKEPPTSPPGAGGARPVRHGAAPEGHAPRT
ncbi:MAG: hypothetical protein ACLGSD_04015 [Acidobacteriota bacterium]